jgi:hypothetical protein
MSTQIASEKESGPIFADRMLLPHSELNPPVSFSKLFTRAGRTEL